ncbi:hypothetical protein RUND412_007796 [Rhizina undulata]
MAVPLQRVASLKLVIDTPKGRGVFATKKLEAGSVIDTAPIILLSQDEFEEHIKHSQLIHYSYNWPRRCEKTGKILMHQAIVLGLGSMFNHSQIRQNVGWKRNIDLGIIVYTALRDIEEGEELLISYGSHLTFFDVETAEAARMAQEEEDDSMDILRIALARDEDDLDLSVPRQ